MIAEAIKTATNMSSLVISALATPYASKKAINI